MEKKEIIVKDLSRRKNISVTVVLIEGRNFMEMRDVELIAPVDIGWDGQNPTVEVNYLKQ